MLEMNRFNETIRRSGIGAGSGLHRHNDYSWARTHASSAPFPETRRDRIARRRVERDRARRMQSFQPWFMRTSTVVMAVIFAAVAIALLAILGDGTNVLHGGLQ